jgi:DNA-binding SARP family transcriptional activator/tetratricopeptide (TPR) repeat protein
MEIRLFGTVEVHIDGRAIDCGPPQQRHVLAVLAATAGRPVTAEALIDRVWDEAPEGARRTLHVYVAGLRRLLPDGVLVRRSGGYVLDVDPNCIDVHRFAALRTGSVRDAIELWRGVPLAGLPGAWAERTREAWRLQYVDAVLARAESEIDTGDPAVAVAPLTALANEYPLTEPLAAMLVRALHAVGRDDEARACYERIRQRLADEFGTDPGAELQKAYRAVRHGSPVPAQLPGDAYRFAGRAEELASLDGILTEAGTVVISAVSGTAGVGKTALAVHWAHRVAGEFPDGQLYVNLRGFDPGGQVMTAAEAVRGFLAGLGVASERVPTHLDAQLSLYRRLVSGRRMLVLLDNARDADQVRPLLPGTPTALAVVTSRNRLAELDATRPVTLDVLSIVEARELLVRRLGTDPVAADPVAVERIIAACARLPLALTIAAARAQVTGLPLGALRSELDEVGGRLDALDAGDPSTRVRAVFSWSYQALRPEAARLFRLLGLHPGPDISVPAAASLAATPLAGALMDELARANLVVEHAPGRHSMHDLLRVYAAELVQQVESEGQRQEATRRLLDHYLHTAYAAALLLRPARDPLRLDPPAPGVVPERLAGHREALDWLDAERAVLLAAVDRAAIAFDAHTWQLAWCLTDYLERRGHWQEHVTSLERAAAAADRLGDRVASAITHRLLAVAYTRTGRNADADREFHLALSLHRDGDDLVEHAHTLRGIGHLLDRKQRVEEAIGYHRRAHRMYRAAQHRTGEAATLNGIGWVQAKLGQYQDALVACGEAYALFRQLDHRVGQAGTLDSIGFIHFQLGRYEDAVDSYSQASALFGELGDRYYEASGLSHIGDAHLGMGNQAGARAAWQRAMTILTELGHADADVVRAKLEAVDDR